MWGQAFLKMFVGKDTRLGKAPHSLTHVHVNVTVQDLVLKFVLCYNPGGNNANGMCMYSKQSSGAEG